MGRSRLGPEVMGPLRTIFDEGATGLRSDAELLDRVARGDGGELAFSALVDRHRPMVLRTCRGILGDPHAAEDAAQVTFLVLARRLGAVRRGETIAPWLYGVAVRVSSKMRVGEARRARHERIGAGRRGERLSAIEGDDTGPVVFEEVGRLPEKERAPVVLCYFEGLSHEEAARRLGWPVGTVQGRLARARDRLRGRLARRGLSPSAGLLAAPPAFTPGMPASPSWIDATVAAAIRIAEGGPGAAGAVPEALSGAAKEVLKEMIMFKGRVIGTLVLVSTMVAGGAVGLAQFGGSGSGPQDDPGFSPRKVAAIPNSDPARKAEVQPVIAQRTDPFGNLIATFDGVGDGREVPLITDLITEVEEDDVLIKALVQVAEMDLHLARRQYEFATATMLEETDLLPGYDRVRASYVNALMQLAGIRMLLKERGFPEEELPTIEPLNMPAVPTGDTPVPGRTPF